MGLALTMSSTVSNNKPVPVFIAEPNDGNKYPGLIIVHEIFGLNEHIKEVAQRFARQGLRVYAPDLFAEAELEGLDRDNLDVMRKYCAKLPDMEIISKLESIFQLALSNPNIAADAVGILGYCMGGAIAFMYACENPQTAFVVDYYGRIKYPELTDTKPRHPIDYAPGLNCPLLGLFSGIDELIPVEHVNLLTDKLAELNKSFQIKIYDNAPHAFFNDTRQHYDPEAAADAWKLTLDFIRTQTKSPLALR